MAIAKRGQRGINYDEFTRHLAAQELTKDQKGPLNLRLALLESFMASKQKGSVKNSKAWAFEPGTLTIVDLSCPFVDESSACSLFAICLAIFLERPMNAGRVVALDEAHKVSLAPKILQRKVLMPHDLVYDCWRLCSSFHGNALASHPSAATSCRTCHHRDTRAHNLA